MEEIAFEDHRGPGEYEEDHWTIPEPYTYPDFMRVMGEMFDNNGFFLSLPEEREG